jgi:hypothetical protein
MLIPVGEDVTVPVTVVVLGPEPEVVGGTLRRLEVDTLLLDVPGVMLRVGVRLIVTAGDPVKLPGRVLEAAGGLWIVSRDDPRPADDRGAPRFATLLDLRWRVADRTQERWIAGGPDPGPFESFNGPADLSVTGVSFDCEGPPPQIGARLLLDLALDDDGQRYRALGAVRRVEARGRRSQLGVEFVDLPESTFEALSDCTLRNL